jgi:D-xylonolactonase
MQHEVECKCVVDSACEVGEGPVWDVAGQRLLWVDILGKSIHAYSPENGSTSVWHVGELIGFVLPCRDGRWIVGLESGLAYVELMDDELVRLEHVERLGDDQRDIRFNDGACDGFGRLWCGTMHMPGTEPRGRLYCYNHAGEGRVADQGYIITNGPAFSRDSRRMYHCESSAHGPQPQGVYAFDLQEDGNIRNKRLLVDYRERQGIPDGLMVDSEDRLWVGEWGGSRVACFEDGGQLLREIMLPTSNVTKAVFGGGDLDCLFVTTATAYLSVEQRAAEPHAGGVFEIRGLGTGCPPPPFENSSLSGSHASVSSVGGHSL